MNKKLATIRRPWLFFGGQRSAASFEKGFVQFFARKAAFTRERAMERAVRRLAADVVGLTFRSRE